MQDQIGKENDNFCLIALGANLPGATGDTAKNLIYSLRLIEAAGIRITNQSHWYATRAYPKESGPDFINAVVRAETDLDAPAILHHLHDIEAQIGRTRNLRWGARICDLDLLSWNDCILPNLETFEYWRNLPFARQTKETPTELILPHPRIQDRGFVLVPLAEILPDWVHPVLGKTAKAMRDALPKATLQEIRPI